MPLFSFEGTSPTVHPTAFVAPTATLVGDVRVEEGASVWYNAVIRADFGPITLRAGANVQDGSVLHGGQDGVEIGPRATVGHLCVVHGAVVGEETIVGNHATIQDGVRIGARCMIGAGSTVPPGRVIPEGTLVLGAPAEVKGPLTASAAWWLDNNPSAYRELARRHAGSVTPAG
jgi:carbonic anhydrase/acetyltransferase-like protein (isoleucine patch superfamily)